MTREEWVTQLHDAMTEAESELEQFSKKHKDLYARKAKLHYLLDEMLAKGLLVNYRIMFGESFKYCPTHDSFFIDIDLGQGYGEYAWSGRLGADAVDYD